MDVSLGRLELTDLAAAVRREWLVTNGLGGYASGTLAGIASRVYHGLLVAAVRPPAERRLAVAGLEAWLSTDGRRVALHTFERADGGFDGTGWERLVGFTLDGARPVWTYAVGDVRIEQRVWMAHGRNTTYVRFAVVGGEAAHDLELALAPLVTWRDHHVPSAPDAPAPSVALEAGAGRIEATVRCDGAPATTRVIVHATAVEAEATPGRRIELRHRDESARGLPDRSELQVPLGIRCALGLATPVNLILTTESDPPDEPEIALATAEAREADLLRSAGDPASAVTRTLVLAADAFVVRRDLPTAGGGTVEGRTIIAGYPWFNDWGRDTMIALPGICLATGRHEDAATILRSFARFEVDGLLPNDFPDAPGAEPGRNTVDASLWYPQAIAAHEASTGDAALVDELLPVVSDILDHHLAGTRYGIRADDDGLLRAGVDGQQLTWMDARVGDREITPRIGKPVEIQALWVDALSLAARWCRERAETDAADRYDAIAARARSTFVARFWRPELGYLADVVDGPDGDDISLRPNQLLALSLGQPLVGGGQARSILEVVHRELETPLGLRTLARDDPRYAGRYAGPAPARDAVYHQGPVWPWLAGPYVDALRRFGGANGRARADAVLEGLVRHLTDAGVGSVSELAEGDPPFEPRGCPWQAWSVGELLRTWRGGAGG